MLLKGPCKVKTIHLITSKDEVRFSASFYLLLISFTYLYASNNLSINLLFNSVVFQESSSQQVSALSEIKQSLHSQNICLDIQYSSTIHDREIRYIFYIINFFCVLLYINYGDDFKRFPNICSMYI